MGHPLGNFTVNQFSRVEVETGLIKLRQVLDLAEIPAFQAKSEIDANQDDRISQKELDDYALKITPDYKGNLLLSVNDTPVDLQLLTTNITLPEGSGNLNTLRIEWDFTGNLPNLNKINRVRFENKNNAERIGWNEVVVSRREGVNIFDSTAYGTGVTDELKAYPAEDFSAPLDERNAVFSFAATELPAGSKPLKNRDGLVSTPVQKDQFADLINVPEVTLSLALSGFLLAFGFGAIHAMSPGHGKAVVGAYLVGSRGTVKHAVFLGLTVTVTHTIGVFALGLVTLFASNYVVPERLLPILNFVSGLLVLFIGLTLFKDRLFLFLGWETRAQTHGHQDFPEDAHFTENTLTDAVSGRQRLTHTHGGSTHTHEPPTEVSWRNLFALGVSGGLLPCPSALVLMLSAISLNRVGYGLILILIFSFGLAATLTVVGLIFLYAGKFFDNPSVSNNRIIKTLPVFSALVIACFGAVICYNSLT